MKPIEILLVTETGRYDPLIEKVVSARSCQVRKCTLADLEAFSHGPDLLLLHLPERSPQPALEAFATSQKQHQHLQDARLLVLAEDATFQAGATSLGASFLTLPFEQEQLLNFLDTFLRQQMTILVADDEPLIRRMFKVYLENEGYTIRTACDGQDAIRQVRETMPDLVITDIKMPKADGYQVCRTIKESKETQHIPVIIVSALGNDIDIEKGFNAGANEFLTKPIDLTELSSRIENLLHGIQLRGRERLLVVAPNPIERSMLEYGLSQQGFEVMSARDGDEALQLAQQELPSIVISDLELPGLDVFSLQDELRARQETLGIPLVVVTSRSTKLDRKRRHQLAPAAYLTKPYPIEKMVAIIERMLGERRSKIELEREMLLWTIASLVHALEARDEYTRGHSESVARYSEQIARRFFSKPEKLKEIRLGALLHDIGKIGIRDAVLLKPGRLTDEEYELIKAHPVMGAEILKPIPSLKNIIPMVRWHHERIDGKGYPDGLAGDEIPLDARILAVADTFDALTSLRPYRAPLALDRALEVIKEVAGTQLDPEVVRVFLEIQQEEGIHLKDDSSSTRQPLVTPLAPRSTS